MWRLCRCLVSRGPATKARTLACGPTRSSATTRVIHSPPFRATPATRHHHGGANIPSTRGALVLYPRAPACTLGRTSGRRLYSTNPALAQLSSLSGAQGVEVVGDCVVISRRLASPPTSEEPLSSSSDAKVPLCEVDALLHIRDEKARRRYLAFVCGDQTLVTAHSLDAGLPDSLEKEKTGVLWETGPTEALSTVANRLVSGIVGMSGSNDARTRQWAAYFLNHLALDDDWHDEIASHSKWAEALLRLAGPDNCATSSLWAAQALSNMAQSPEGVTWLGSKITEMSSLAHDASRGAVANAVHQALAYTLLSHSGRKGLLSDREGLRDLTVQLCDSLYCDPSTPSPGADTHLRTLSCVVSLSMEPHFHRALMEADAVRSLSAHVKELSDTDLTSLRLTSLVVQLLSENDTIKDYLLQANLVRLLYELSTRSNDDAQVANRVLASLSSVASNPEEAEYAVQVDESRLDNLLEDEGTLIKLLNVLGRNPDSNIQAWAESLFELYDSYRMLPEVDF